jgi:Domain of unknown function (DUF4375)
MSELKWLEEYSGQTVEQLLSLEGAYRTDSIVVAFQQAVDQKVAREGDEVLNPEERIIVAIEALEAEVNNGGYAQFFLNSSREYAPTIVQALVRIGCPRTAEITQRAIDALHLSSLTDEAIETAMANDEVSEDDLNECDDSYYKSGEDIAGQLFAFIKANKDVIGL